MPLTDQQMPITSRPFVTEFRKHSARPQDQPLIDAGGRPHHQPAPEHQRARRGQKDVVTEVSILLPTHLDLAVR